MEYRIFPRVFLDPSFNLHYISGMKPPTDFSGIPLDNDIEADYFEACLKEAGIDCYVRNTGLQSNLNLTTLTGSAGMLLGGLELMVRVADAAQAKKLIADLRAAPFEPERNGSPASIAGEGQSGDPSA